MKIKYFLFGLIAFSLSLGWNIFLIKRDDAMFKAYYQRQAIQNLTKPPSSEIR